jgi:uncharacterized protein (TIGR02145 family)
MKKLLFVLLVLSVFAVHAQVPSYVPTNGLVAYYPFNGNANDASGNGNNGTVNGATLTTDRFGDVGKAYSFNGVSNFIEIANNSIFNFESQNRYSISYWIKPQTLSSSQAQVIIMKQDGIGDSQDGWNSFIEPNQKLNFYVRNGVGAPYSGCNYGNLSVGTYIHVIQIFKSDSVSVYLNGIKVGAASTNGAVVGNNSSSIFFGKAWWGLTYPNTIGYNGSLDDIAIYNRALSSQEISNLYSSSAPCIANITNNDTSICRGSSIILNAAAVNAASLTDINGNVYPTVNIGTQTWMQKNLNVSKYKNGDIITQVTNANQWAALTTGAWCWYNNDSATYAATYGKLYNWYAVNDSRGLAPNGWHVPSDGEWTTLTDYLGGAVLAGGKLKETGTTHWNSPNTGATNSSGFLGLPSGYRGSDGALVAVGQISVFGTSTLSSNNDVWRRIIHYQNESVSIGTDPKTYGYSIRTLRNTPTTYLWSTGATTPSITVSPTVTTKYYCTVSDGINTCKDSVTVTVSTITTNIITADTVKVCGTSTTISATTGLSNYAWSNGANTASTPVTSSGWYKCTATIGACTAIDSVYVSLFNPKITQNDTTVCAGTPLTLTVNNNTSLTSSLPANLRNGLVGYWPFNGNANDESGNGNNGTVNGATLTTDRFGNVGKAYSFNNNTITVPHNSNFSIVQSGQQTISFWSYLVGTSSIQHLMGKRADGGSTWNWQIGFNSTSVNSGISYATGASDNAYGVLTNDALPQNQWVNVTGTYNNGIWKLYLNGTILATTNTNIFYNDIVCPLVFGNSGGFASYYGKLDDIAIYNRALSATEIQQLYSGATYLWSTTATTPSITVTPTATTSYIATVSNGINTCKDTVKITVTNVTSLSPTTIFGAVDVCAAIGADTASVPVNYKINKVANAASYVWTVPAGATLLSGQGDTSIMVRFSSSFVSGAITVKSVSICNISSAVKSVTVYKRVAAAPTAIQKEFTPTSIVATTNVSGLVSEVYRIKKVLYATSYNWYLNRGTNASITHINTSGENDTAVIVTFASCFVKDTLSVKSVTPCSISLAKTVIMSSSTTPATVAGITTVGGDFAVCIGSSKTFTAIASTPTTAQVGIARYRWTNPLNTVITSATSDSSSITVSFNTGFTGGSLTCKGISACGVVGTTATTAILQYLPPAPLSIATSTNSYNACINSSVTYTALVSAPTTAQVSASVFRWTRPNNTTITSATADSSSITVRFNTGYTGGVISVKGQSRCGAQGAARSQMLTHTGCALGTKMSLPITTTNAPSFEVSLYPNPTTNEFKLLIKNNTVVGSNKPSKAIIKVIDLQGRMMKSFTTNTNQAIAIGNELKAGVYIVEVRVGEEVKTIRAVKF